MDINTIIAEHIKRYAGGEEWYAVSGKAKNVDTDLWLMDLEVIGGADVLKVRLKATEDGDPLGVVQVPEDGANCVVIFENKTDGFLFLCDKVAEVWIRGGTNGGLINVEDLVTRMNNIENKVNEILTWTGTHTHAGVTAGPGMSGIASPVTGSLDLTEREDVEDETVKH